ncbi:hypothetical protein F4677DRAFT_413350 [Hypoxylon crocopeplum]|nr:hypothetical protein F4677DRAFT_413350 [Hypoxylon crocopeplum]
MEATHRSYLRHHHRSSSLPPSWAALQEHDGGVNATKRIRANSLETTTYEESKQREGIKVLMEECSTQLTTIAKRAMHFKAVRENPVLRGYLDTARDYAHQLQDLHFHLSGPDKIDFLPQEGREQAIASLRRAKVTLASACWRVRRYIELCAISILRPATRVYVWDNVLRKEVDVNKQAAERNVHEFWKKEKPKFGPLLHELKEEILRMKSVVQHLDRSKNPPFIAQLEEEALRGRPCIIPPFLRSIDPADRRPDEMSGALPVDKGHKTQASVNKTQAVVNKAQDFIDKLKIGLFERLVINSGMDFEPDFADRIRYRVLETKDKWLWAKKPDVAIAAWAAFREDLDKKPGPPSTGTILLTHKVDTQRLLAERKRQQPEDQVGAGSQEVGQERKEDEGSQAEQT